MRAAAAPTWWSDTWSRTAESRRSGCSKGLEQLPTLMMHYRGIRAHEFDLDAALRAIRRMLLVDELAHTNLGGGEPAPRHPKRWQDVEELLEAGIDVWTTVNVQHLESLNDVIAQITGVQPARDTAGPCVREADEVELIDLPPDDLLARLRAGKVYVQREVANAVERFFRKRNLIALREMALRQVADRVEAAARASAATERPAPPEAGGGAHPGRDRAGCASRTTGASRQTTGRCPGCRLDRGLRRDAGFAAICRRLSVIAASRSCGSASHWAQRP